MRKLTTLQIKTKHELQGNLTLTASEIVHEIQTLNALLEEARARIGGLTGHYNEIIEEANALIESIHDAQENYLSERSEAWASSDQGDAYRDWADAWSEPLDEYDFDLPEPLEEPEFTAPDALFDLPEQP